MILIAIGFATALVSGVPAHDAQGKALIDCRVTSQGWLRDCKVVSETPVNANVGAFALKLAKGYHVQPDDRRIKAGRIRVPMQFKMPR